LRQVDLAQHRRRLLKPTRGEAKLDGKAITKPGSDRGVVFQQYSLFPWLSVRKNVEFGLKMAGVEQSKRNTTARALLDLAGLLSFENHYPDQLSGGMKQRVGIARALATSPQVLLMTSRSVRSTRRRAS
jgi:NitT/TauT family transport system ATP-binding protein